MLRPRTVEPDTLHRSALFFAPHEDDETLGCGGMIIQKRAKEADVGVVFMTDGRQSHAHIMHFEQLVDIRRQEAIAACQVLGVAEHQVKFLEFTDGLLSNSMDAAVELVLDLLVKNQPAEVFIPYFKEPPADHVATNMIVLAALKRYGQLVTVYEYPVWFWHHWPWVSLKSQYPEERRAILKNTISTILGWRLFLDFNYFIDITGELEIKCQALEQHKTQMSRLLPDRSWLTLHDVANGEWLNCFFQEMEIYRRYQSRPGTSF
jgi:LmbE family N-acetylglucosaminyl deacetylase